uniref:Uncharacterized protein n=1 Tax=Candidatus Kentrum sp. LFY TaxID=2126342 RepID=A0A450WKN7_9GAMM|nr:MAG: hypothetical protein BECKLFY1418C_GA0070996_103324 [Candidatus Kentron sp. LFY]
METWSQYCGKMFEGQNKNGRRNRRWLGRKDNIKAFFSIPGRILTACGLDTDVRDHTHLRLPESKTARHLGGSSRWQWRINLEGVS